MFCPGDRFLTKTVPFFSDVKHFFFFFSRKKESGKSKLCRHTRKHARFGARDRLLGILQSCLGRHCVSELLSFVCFVNASLAGFIATTACGRIQSILPERKKTKHVLFKGLFRRPRGGRRNWRLSPALPAVVVSLLRSPLRQEPQQVINSKCSWKEGAVQLPALGLRKKGGAPST